MINNNLFYDVKILARGETHLKNIADEVMGMAVELEQLDEMASTALSNTSHMKTMVWQPL